MDKIKAFFKSKQAKRFFWNTLAGFLGVVAVYISGLDWYFAPVAFAILNGISKELNK